MDSGQSLAREFGIDRPLFSIRRRLYRPYIHGRRDVYELVSGAAVVSLRFSLVADDATLGEFIQAIQNSLQGALIDTDTRLEEIDDKSVLLREVRVRCYVQ